MTKTVLGFIPVALLACATLGPASAHGADQAQPQTSPPGIKNHQRTGQYENCLTSHRIRDIRILNNRQILFTMNGGDAYLAEPERCAGLSKGLALAYDATLNQLCNTTIVHLIDPGSPVPQRGTCGIERFERLKKTAP